MKKTLFVLFIFISMTFLYLHQPPILKTGEAIITANKHLNNLPKEYETDIKAFDLKKIPDENVSASLYQKDGFLNEILNKTEWHVTIKHKENEVWIVIDSNSGKLLKMTSKGN